MIDCLPVLVSREIVGSTALLNSRSAGLPITSLVIFTKVRKILNQGIGEQKTHCYHINCELTFV